MYNLNEGNTIRMVSKSSDYILSGVILKSLQDGEGKLGPITFVGKPGSKNDFVPIFVFSLAIDFEKQLTIFGDLFSYPITNVSFEF